MVSLITCNLIAILLQAVHRAARRWRLTRIGHLLLHMLPQSPELVVHADRSGTVPAGMATTILGFADVLEGLLRPRRVANCKLFDDWDPKHACFLRSAITGGQCRKLG